MSKTTHPSVTTLEQLRDAAGTRVTLAGTVTTTYCFNDALRAALADGTEVELRRPDHGPAADAKTGWTVTATVTVSETDWWATRDGVRIPALTRARYLSAEPDAAPGEVGGRVAVWGRVTDMLGCGAGFTVETADGQALRAVFTPWLESWARPTDGAIVGVTGIRYCEDGIGSSALVPVEVAAAHPGSLAPVPAELATVTAALAPTWPGTPAELLELAAVVAA